jgi:peptide chain release factor 1
MLEWNVIQKEYDELVQKLTNQNLDQRTRATLQRQASHYNAVLDLHKQIVELQESIQTCKQQAEKEHGEIKALYEEEIVLNQPKLADLEQQLEEKLYPADKRNERSVFLEIRAGTGGQEAALFAADLFRMYGAYAEIRGWNVSVVESSQTDLGGFKELIAYIEGKNVYKFLKFESGVHRVQRVPKTEAAGRIHTSTVTVAVLPEAEEVDVSISPADLRVDVYRSSGAGGQHVNTTDSAVRITHIPTGLVVTCQDERSQIKNKAKAMKVLQARLYEAECEKREAEERAARKQQIGGGERAEKIRTYNFPQNRVTDHRVDVTLKKLDMVMQGDLDDLLMPLLEKEMIDRREQGILFT